VEPKVLLLDEPFGALDAKVRKDLRRWLRRLHDELHITSVFVTHDQEEALEVADRIVVLNQGKIEQTGTPVDVYDNPATPFVFKFLGNVNVFQSRVHEGIARIGDLNIDAPDHGDAENLSALAYVRPHDVELQREAEGASFSARVQDIHAIGPVVRLELQHSDEDSEPIEVELQRERFTALGLVRGDTVYVKPRNLRLFPN
jgi:sulfate transport system ATP-binding protein